MKLLKHSNNLIIQVLLILGIFIISLKSDFQLSGLYFEYSILTYVPLIVFCIITLLHILEYITNNYNWITIIRTLFFLLAIIVIIAQNTFPMVNAMIIAMMIPNTILLSIILLPALFSKKNKKEKKSIKSKTLPVTWFSDRDYNIYIIVLFFYIIIALIYIIFLPFGSIWIRIILSLLNLFIITFAFSLRQTLLLRKKMIIFEQTLNYDELINYINKLRLNRLDQDSKTYLDLIEINCLFAINLSDAVVLFDSISKPNFTEYKLLYNLIALYKTLNCQEYELFDEYYNQALLDLDKIKTKNFWIKRIEKVKLIKNMKQYNICDPIIASLYKLEGKNKFSDLCNSEVLAQYYYAIGDREEATKYIEFIKTNGSVLTQLIKDMEELTY